LLFHIEEAACVGGWDASGTARTDADGTMPYFDSSTTEIMSVGFSDGAGASVWMQFQGHFGAVTKGITQVVAIDYWAFNSYDTWMALPSTPGVMDTKIYANCYSGVFNDGMGSKAIFPWTSSDTTTLPLASGYPATPTVAAGFFTKYDWEMTDGSCKRFSFWVHGLSHAGSPADWTPNTTFWTSDGACTDPQQMTVPVNGSVHWAMALGTTSEVIGDIADWVAAPASWDPNSPSSIPCYDSPSPPPPSPIYKPKPKPWQKPKPHEKWFAKFVDEEEQRAREVAQSKYMYAYGRRMQERQLSGGETMKDVEDGAAFEEEMVNMSPPPAMLKGRKPKRPIDSITKKEMKYSDPKLKKYGEKYFKEKEEEKEEKPPPKKK